VEWGDESFRGEVPYGTFLFAVWRRRLRKRRSEFRVFRRDILDVFCFNRKFKRALRRDLRHN
jgi:hypothetical protein